MCRINWVWVEFDIHPFFLNIDSVIRIYFLHKFKIYWNASTIFNYNNYNYGEVRSIFKLAFN